MPEAVPWKILFLTALRQSPNISRAADAAGLSRQAAYKARDADPEFAADWDDALGTALDKLEGVAYDRAIGESDTLAIFLLKSHRPQIYGDRNRLEVSGPDGGPVEFLAAIDKVYGDADGTPTAD
jgi:hypothetical protein